MKLKRFWNERDPFDAHPGLAVALPAAALIIASVWHLRGIQRENAVEALFQRDFAHVLAISEKHMNQKAYDLVGRRSGATFPALTSCALRPWTKFSPRILMLHTSFYIDRVAV